METQAVGAWCFGSAIGRVNLYGLVSTANRWSHRLTDPAPTPGARTTA